MTDNYHLNKKIKSHFGFKGLWLVLIIFVLASFFCLAPLIWYGAKAGTLAAQSFSISKQLANDISGQDWSKSAKSIETLSKNLVQIDSSLSRLGPISLLPKIRNDVQVARQFLTVSQSLTDSYLAIFNILAQAEKSGLVMDQNSLWKNKEAGKLISQNKKELLLAQEKLDQARRSFAAISTNEFPGFLAKPLRAAHSQLQQVLESTDLIVPAISLLPDFLGYEKEKHYLLVFENNMELRPTGGFIGSYGLITVQDGQIKNIFTDDVYNLDKLSEGKLKRLAPRPMAVYNNQTYWYMRDANWPASWPDSAKTVADFFAIERQNANLPAQKLDGVIAITPDFIANILEVVGPIESHGVVFRAENFAWDLEKFVENDFAGQNIPYEERKAIIGVLSNKLIEKMENTTSSDLVKLWLAFKKNIDQKNILVYMFDEQLQAYFSQRNWAGEIRPATGDYLMLIDSNFAALKTDSVMKRSIKRSLSLNTAGDLISRLEITYQHTGQFVRNFITRYRTYAKIYVPQGSWFENGQVKEGDKAISLDMSKDLEYGTEYGKAYVAYFLVIEPGATKTIILNYKLPAYLKKQFEDGSYSLLVQKQPGTIGHLLSIDLNLSQEISAYQADSWPSAYHKTSISWQSDLAADREYHLKF